MTGNYGSREHRTGEVCPLCEAEFTLALGTGKSELHLECDCGCAVVLGSITSSFAHAA